MTITKVQITDTDLATQDSPFEKIFNDEDRLVRENMPLVHYAVAEVANRIPSYVHRNDLISAGMFGLAQAARSWDPRRGIPFDKYAVGRVRGALLDELRSHDWASRSVRTKSRGVKTAVDKLTGDLGRNPTLDEVANSMNVEIETIHKLQDDVHRATVLNYESLLPDGDPEEILASSERSPEEILENREKFAYLSDSVSALPPRLQRVIEGYFFEEKPMQLLAEELGVSESRISQLRSEAIDLLRDGMNAQLQPDLLQNLDQATTKASRRKMEYCKTVEAISDFKSRVSARTAQTGE